MIAESVIGLFKAEVIHCLGPWRGFDDVEYATLEWVAGFNGSRLLEPLGCVPLIQFEAACYACEAESAEGRLQGCPGIVDLVST